MKDDELRDALRVTVPTAPEVSTWAESARRQSRRTRGMVAGGALLAVVVGALVIGNLRPGGIVGIPAAPASSTPVASTAPASTPTAGDCDQGTPVPAAPQQLPPGATDVQLCPDGYDPDATFVTPVDRLTEGVQALLDAIDSAPARPLARNCTDGFARTFRVVFHYADGSRVTLIARLASSESLADGRSGACDGIGGPDTWRSGDLLQRLRSAWLHQRASTRAGQPYPSPNCSIMSPTLFAADLNDVSTAILCGRGGSNQARSVVLTTQQTRPIVLDIAQRSRPGGDDTQDFNTLINLFTPWGDMITVYRAETSDKWGFLNDMRSGLMWTPSLAIRTWLNPIIDGAPPTWSPSGQR